MRGVGEKLVFHAIDLSGPKIRTGRFASGSIELQAGELVTVTTRRVLGGPGLIPSQYVRLAGDVRRGSVMFLDDGSIELEVERVRGKDIRCRVVRGGTLSDRKGINLPGCDLSTPSLTAKDRRDAKAAAEMGVDYLALSFVRTARDVRSLRSLLRRLDVDIPIVAKIEKPEALDNIEGVLETADAVMVARGDLGVELPVQQVPIVQRELVRRAIVRNRPVIVATQMLESMIERARPTRAEVNDVATAAFLGADAVMLSAETAAGKYPIESVRMMDRILREVEGYQWSGDVAVAGTHPLSSTNHELRLHDAIGRATAGLAQDLLVRLIFVPSRTGTSIRTVSSDRPSAPVVGASEDERICRRVALCWGVVPVRMGPKDVQSFAEAARRIARGLKLARRGQHMLLVRGFDPDPRRSTPSVTVLRV